MNRATGENETVGRPSIGMFAYCCLVIYWSLSSVVDFIDKFIHPPALCSVSDGSIHVADFVQMYVGGKLALLRDGSALYDVDSQLRLMNAVTAPVHLDRILPLTYLPAFYVGMIPFTTLSLSSAYLLWCVMSLTAVFFSLAVLATRIGGFNIRQTVLFCAACLVCLPFQVGLQLGQTCFFLAAGLSFFFLSFLKQRDYLAGACLAIVMIKPQYGLFFLVPCLVLGRWKILAAFLIVFLGQNVIAASILGLQAFSDYIHYMTHVAYFSKAFGMSSESHSNLRHLIAMFIPDGLASKLAVPVMFFGVAACWLIWHRLKDSPPAVHQFALAYTTILALLFAPHSNFHDAVILAPVALLTLGGLSISAIRSPAPLGNPLWKTALMAVPLLSFISMLVQSYGINTNAPTILMLNLVLMFSGASVLWQAALLAQPVVLDH